MADSPSWGGHLYAVMGSLDGFIGDNPVAKKEATPGLGWGCDSNRESQWVSPGGKMSWIPSCIPDLSIGLPNGGAFEPTPAKYVPTILDELRAASLTWKIYGAAESQNGGYQWAICPSIAECLYTSQRSNLLDPTQFITAAAAGALPAISIITPGGSEGQFLDSCHNQRSMTACDNWAGHLVSAIMNSPDWSSTATFIVFDDFGGFYDQVPPPMNPDGTRAGPRVPLIIVWPYAKPGYTDTTATSFAGILAYTEQNFGLAPLGPNDAAAYPFTNAFNYAQAPLKPVRMVTRPLPRSARRIHITKVNPNDPT